jgi:hypothetical protein
MKAVALGIAIGLAIALPSALSAFAKRCALDNSFRAEVAASNDRLVDAYTKLNATLKGLTKP